MADIDLSNVKFGNERQAPEHHVVAVFLNVFPLMQTLGNVAKGKLKDMDINAQLKLRPVLVPFQQVHLMTILVEKNDPKKTIQRNRSRK